MHLIVIKNNITIKYNFLYDFLDEYNQGKV